MIDHDLADLTPAAQIVTEALAAAPGAAVAARRGSRVGAGVAGAHGDARWAEQHPAARARVALDSLFDLASVTKSLVAVSAARLARGGALALDEPLGALVPELADSASGEVPLELLLAHRAGLEAHIKLWLPVLEGRPVELAAAARVAADSRRAGCAGAPPPEGFAPVYSDMGYLLVGLALARRGGLPLDELVAREVLAPLGLVGRIGSARQFAQALGREAFLARTLPTEEIAFRGGVVHGLVHDENAFALSGDALSGHAGLFGEVGAVLAFGEAVLAALRDDAGWLGPDDLSPLVRDRPGGSLLAGFDRRAGEQPLSGARLSPRTFGHLGFTGTSLWIDPERAFVGVLLTNRVHRTREHTAIRAARPRVYDAMFDALGGEE